MQVINNSTQDKGKKNKFDETATVNGQQDVDLWIRIT